MLSEKRIRKLAAQSAARAGCLGGKSEFDKFVRAGTVLARLVEAAACENMRRDADIELLDAESRRVLGAMLLARARAARKAAEESDDAAR